MAACQSCDEFIDKEIEKGETVKRIRKLRQGKVMD